jgi:hypothetical protein
LHGVRRCRLPLAGYDVIEAVENWPRYAQEARVLADQRERIARTLRLHFPKE